jgi:hypothetical protein
MDVREAQERAACLPLERLEAEIQTLAAHLAAAECRWLLFVAEFDRRKGWQQWGCWSAAMWLSWKCGLAPRAAKEKVRVARALGGLPAITEAFSRGELSYSQVRALTRVAESATEGTLLGWAKHSTAAQLERIVRAYRGARRRADETDDANNRRDRRSLTWFWDDDGSLVGSFRLPPEDGAKLRAALDAQTRDVEKGCSAGHPYRDLQTKTAANPFGARRADALMGMVAAALDHRACDPSRRAVPEMVVHIDLEALAAGGDGRCHADDGPALAVETARRLACDAGLIAMLDDAEGNPLAVGPKDPIPAALRRAVHARDQGCRFPGCGRHGRLDLHHIIHRCAGGPTNIENLIELCPFHHHLVHEGGWTIEQLDDGSLRFTRPDGTPIEPVPRCEIDLDEGGIEARNQEAGLHIGASTIDSRWDGTAANLVDTTELLMWQHQRAQRDR